MSRVIVVGRSREYDARMQALLGEDIATVMGAYLSFGAQIALDQLAGDDAEVALLGPFLSYEDASELVTALLRRFPDLGLVLVHENHAEIEEWVSELPFHSVLSPTADDETVLELLGEMRAWLIEAGDVDGEAPAYGAIPTQADAEPRLAVVTEESGLAELDEIDELDDVQEAAPIGDVQRLAEITTVSSEHGEDGRVIAVVSPKGGLGKTTVATNLAVGLARVAPLSVVVVDADVQFGDVATALALSPDHTLPDMVAGLAPRDTMVLKTFLTVHPAGFYVVCGSDDPAAGDRVSGEQVGHLVRQLAGIFRFVIVDTAPGLGEHALSVLDNASDAIVLCSMSVPSVRGLRQELATLAALDILPGQRHVVLNFADRVSGLTAKDVEATIGVPVDVAIPRSNAVALSTNRGVPLLGEGSRDPAAKALNQIVVRFDSAAAKKRGRAHRRVVVA
ncbi:pilus assembly protein CpaE [Microterricola gilva]|uniref:Pilus assembly protein CpaE n=1 Tax=Microterricola gilva TaxID=393267 RepID=A0A4Q8ARD8_9MICO|nr:AAA family ATPase [Microterricola gilva]RZU66665.1 pilus assembly protein CpaE [Microterricola gilva]